ncbi:MAG TPA: hypothetical protein VIK75_06555 [Calditerricola sp.]
MTADAGQKAARPHDELIRELLDSRVPKSEREHAAAREIERLREKVERFKSMTEATMGIGSGDGNLFVHGDYESIKAAQAVVLERDALRTEVAEWKRVASAQAELHGEAEDENERLRAGIEALATVLVDEWKRVAAARSEAEDENERLRAEVREAREFRDKLVKAIGNEQLRAFIEKYGEPVPLTNRVQAAEARADKLQAEVERSERYAEQSERERLWAEERAERLADALRLAEEHINALTPEWYSAGQRVLTEIRAALAQENRNDRRG